MNMPALRSAAFVVGACAALCLSVAARGDGPLFPIAVHPIGYASLAERSVAVDLNADGRPDIVTPGQGTLSILHRLADGTYGSLISASPAPTSASFSPGYLAVGDIDADGDEDLVQTGNGSVWVYRNSGTGTFGPPDTATYPGGSVGGSAELDDFDGDGDLDIFVVGGSELRVLINDGLATGTFSTTVVTVTFSSQSDTFALIDVDGDGDRDAVGLSSSSLQFAERISIGGFAPRVVFPLPASPNTNATIAWGDIDADGDIDAVVGLQNGQVGVLKGDGDGGYGPMTVLGIAQFTGSGFMTDLVLEDVDGDGDLDIAGVGMTVSDIYVLVNDGAGGFGTLQYITGAGKGLRLSFADTDGDGDRDAIVHVRATQSNAIGIIDRNSPAGFLTPNATDIGIGGPARIGDHDCDGDVDVFTFHLQTGSGNGTRWLTNDGFGNLAPIGPWQQNQAITTAATGELNGLCGAEGVMAFYWDVDLGDVDGDGDLDRIDIANNLDTISVRPNDGTGFFPNTPTHYPQGSIVRAVSVADLNGDDAVDIVFARCGEIGAWGGDCSQAASIGVMLNDGTGQFDPPVFTPCLGARELVIRDVNADGIPDVVVVNSMNTGSSSAGNDALTVLLNDGLGALTTHSTHVGIGIGPRDIALGFVDDDALIDAVVVCFTSANVAVLLGDPVTLFAPPVLFAAGGNSVSVDVADIDGDGDEDIVVGRGFRGPMVLMNQRLAPAPLACAGDINLDGTTNAADFTVLAGNFGTPSGATRSQGDLSGDGAVNAADFVILAGDFGCSSPN